VCRALVTYDIDGVACTGCVKCVASCPSQAISGEKKKPHSIDQAKCEKCGICYEVCEQRAVVRK